MPGELVQASNYNSKTHCRHEYIENTFFRDTFGMNEFEAVDDTAVHNGQVVGYITKYIQKTGSRAVYSRDIPEYLEMSITIDDVINIIPHPYGDKYVLFEDIFIDPETQLRLNPLKRRFVS
jgi:hypothetical protein